PPPSFFFTAPPPPPISTLSLHDALPIFEPGRGADRVEVDEAFLGLDHAHHHDLVVGLGHVIGAAVVHGPYGAGRAHADRRIAARSEEHTSELQSRSDLVCRLLLEKKKKK